ncbi:odorant receptor 9a-like [Lutzomyia longipalpis]|uniref:odorant receptor 9a-like n=1 Tax=Lutzomyia longipalpis TaxID=7200 RepID=UPI00248358C9|nr:odorant receptor 9a-like [Lutzomyia longipalpis]
MVITAAKLYWLFLYTSKLRNLLVEIQDHVNKRVRCGKGHHYLEADLLGNRFTRSFGILVFIASILYSLNPPLQILVQYMKDTGKPYIYKLPYHFALGVDYSISPNYELIYTSSFLSLMPVLNAMVSANCLFFCFSLQIAACFKDLQEMVESIAERTLSQQKYSIESDDGASLIILVNANPEEEGIFHRNIRECLEFHATIIRWIDETGEALSGIIAFEFAGCIFSFCTQAFQAALNIQSPEFLNSVVFFMAEGIELFLFAAFGERIATESTAIADSAFGTSWYRFPPRHRKYFGLMIQRAQRPCYLSALNWLHCSLESYMNVLKASFSMMALLQNLNEKGGLSAEQEAI